MPTQSKINAVKAAIVAEFRRQAPGVYFGDDADAEIFNGGPAEMMQIRTILGNRRGVADRFDMDAVARVAIAAFKGEPQPTGRQ
jgi:hypothetical protein